MVNEILFTMDHPDESSLQFVVKTLRLSAYLLNSILSDKRKR